MTKAACASVLRTRASRAAGARRGRKLTLRNPLLASTRPSRPTTTISSSVGGPARTRAAVAHAPSATSAARSKPAAWASSNACRPLLALRDRFGERRRAARLRDALASASRSTAPRFECRSSRPWASFAIFAGPPAMVTRGDRMLAQIFERAADEIAHVDQRMIGQAVARADRGLGGLAGRGADMRATARARDVHPAMDRMDPGRARIGDDDPGRAEDRETPDDAEAPVPGALGDPFAAGDRDLDRRVGACAEPRGDFFEIGADHRARRGIDRGLADRQRQAGPRHRADAFARLEAHARARRRETHGRHDQRAMSDVRIVARVLDDAGAGEIGAKLMGREREFGPQALRQRDRNRIGKLAGQQRFEGRARRAAGAGAGRPSAPEGRRVSGSLMRPGLARGAQFA